MKMQKLRIFGVAVSMIFSLLTIAGFQGGCNSPSKAVAADSNTSSNSSEVVQGDVSNAPTETSSGDSSLKSRETASSATHQTDGKLTWMDFAEGYTKAKAENKILLVDAYTDWCSWCKVMDRETYTNAQVIAVLNNEFVCVKFNPEVEKKHKFGAYNLSSNELLYWLANGQPGGYPTSYFIFNPAKNDKRAAQAGYLPPDQFLNLLGEVIKRKKQSE
jgi:thioredoxin-related protein